MKYTLFYAWQSEKKENKNLIRNALFKAKEKLEEQYDIEIEIIDSPTKGESGSPDIYNKIVENISNADVFLGEVSAIYTIKGRDIYISNSNVMFEVGYALATLGEDQCILLSDTDIAAISKLSFDINHKRISPYKLSEGKDKLSNDLCHYIREATKSVSRKKDLLHFIFNEIVSGLEIIYNNYMRMCFGYDEMIPLSFEYSKEDLKEKIKANDYCFFQLFKDNEKVITEIKKQIKQLCYVNYTNKYLSYKLANLIDGVEYINLLNLRSNYGLFDKVDRKDSNHYYGLKLTKDIIINDLSYYNRFNNNFIFKKGACLLAYGDKPWDKDIPYLYVDVIDNIEELLRKLNDFEVPFSSYKEEYKLDLYYDVPLYKISNNDYICSLTDTIIEMDCFIKDFLPILGIKINDNLYNRSNPGYIINFE